VRSGATLVTACLALSLAGCGTYNKLAPGASSVVATVTRPAGKCESLGTLSGKGGGASGSYVSNEELIEYALNDLRNQAVARGASHVVYSTPSMGGTGGTTTSAMVTGEALSCSDAPETTTATAPATAAQSAPTDAGACRYDTQCKGERICVKGECIDPPTPSSPSSPPSSPPAEPTQAEAKP
jgi:hypothetical protein